MTLSNNVCEIGKETPQYREDCIQQKYPLVIDNMISCSYAIIKKIFPEDFFYNYTNNSSQVLNVHYANADLSLLQVFLRSNEVEYNKVFCIHLPNKQDVFSGIVIDDKKFLQEFQNAYLPTDFIIDDTDKKKFLPKKNKRRKKAMNPYVISPPSIHSSNRKSLKELKSNGITLEENLQPTQKFEEYIKSLQELECTYHNLLNTLIAFQKIESLKSNIIQLVHTLLTNKSHINNLEKLFSFDAQVNLPDLSNLKRNTKNVLTTSVLQYLLYNDPLEHTKSVYIHENHYKQNPDNIVPYISHLSFINNYLQQTLEIKNKETKNLQKISGLIGITIAAIGIILGITLYSNINNTQSIVKNKAKNQYIKNK